MASLASRTSDAFAIWTQWSSSFSTCRLSATPYSLQTIVKILSLRKMKIQVAQLTTTRCTNGSECSLSCRWQIDKSTIHMTSATLSKSTMEHQLMSECSKTLRSSWTLALTDLKRASKTLQCAISVKTSSKDRSHRWSSARIVATLWIASKISTLWA